MIAFQLVINKKYYVLFVQYYQQSKLNIESMSDINNSLIGFLKKKSLFSESPIKSFQLKDRSKEKRDIANTVRSPKSNMDASFNNNSQSSKNLHQETSFRKHRQQTESQAGHQSLYVEKQSRFNNNSILVEQDNIRQTVPKRTFNFQSTTNTKSLNATKMQDDNNINVWTGLVNYANSFESARIQSAQCLQTLSIKLNAELSNINYKLDVFHTKMVQMLDKQFSNAKDKIYSIVNKVFQQAQQSFRVYIKQQEENLAYDLLQMRDILTKEYQKVQYMKEQINRPSWKKVAGELLSTELQEKVQNLLKKSRMIDIKNWEVGDLGLAKVTTLEGQLKDMIKLTVR